MSEQRLPGDAATLPEAKETEEAFVRHDTEARHPEREREYQHGTWIWCPSTGEMSWSEGLFDLLGRRSATDSPTYHALIGAIHSEDQGLFLLQLEGALKHGRAMSLEHRVVLSDGRSRYVRSEIDRLPNGIEEGGGDRWVGLMQGQSPGGELLHRIRMVAESIPDVFWLTTLHFGKTLYVSGAYEHLWGRTREELYHDPRAFMDSIVPDDLERAARDLACRGSGCAYETDYRIRHPSGAIRWIHERGYPVRDARGAVWAMAGTAGDVTCQKNEEDELREADDLLRHELDTQRSLREELQVALDALPIMIAWFDGSGRPKSMNRLMQSELGWAPSQWEHMDFMAETFPDGAYRERVLGYVRQGNATWRDIHFRNRAGEYHDYTWCFVTIGDGSTFGVGIDLHERRNMERRLRESEAKFRSVYESNVVPFMFWHNGGRINAANDAYLRLIGYSREDLEAGRIDALRITPDEYRPLDDHALQEQRSGRTVATPYEKDLLRKDGTRVPVLAGGALFPDGKSGMSFAIDLSERKEAEDALRSLNKELHETLEALRASQSHAIQIEKLSALGTLAAGVAHELNNPLMGVMNYVDYAKRVVRDPELKPVLAGASRELDRMRDLLHNMLAFVRPSDEPFEQLRLDLALTKALALMRPEFNELQIEVKMEVEESLPLVQAKDAQLQQVLVNLLMNARDALAGAEERRIRICARRRDPFVAVDVQDSGPGIPDTIQEKIFDPFFTTKEPGFGTGLGLSISRSIMLEAGGDLIYQGPAPIHGAVFTVLIPATPRTQDRNAPANGAHG